MGSLSSGRWTAWRSSPAVMACSAARIAGQQWTRATRTAASTCGCSSGWRGSSPARSAAGASRGVRPRRCASSAPAPASSGAPAGASSAVFSSQWRLKAGRGRCSVGVVALSGGRGWVLSTGNMLGGALRLGALPLPAAAAGFSLLQNRWLHTARAALHRRAPARPAGHLLLGEEPPLWLLGTPPCLAAVACCACAAESRRCARLFLPVPSSTLRNRFRAAAFYVDQLSELPANYCCCMTLTTQARSRPRLRLAMESRHGLRGTPWHLLIRCRLA